jgi:very-short-patch-repair endonuclease
VRPFVGSEAIAAGALTAYQLKTAYTAIYRNVYIPRGQAITPVDKAIAAWLWSERRGIVVGVSAAALHGSLWIDAALPAELNHRHRHKTRGIVLHSDSLFDGEVCVVNGVPSTTPARTAYDLGRFPGLETAVIRLDALMQPTHLKAIDVSVLADRHRGARGIKQLREAIILSDAGAESPQETRTRLVLTHAGLRPKQTQIKVFDRFGVFVRRIDMGWADWKVGVEYDGEQHWTDPGIRAHDIEWQAQLEALGWRIIRVSADLLRYRKHILVERVRDALRAAGAPVYPANVPYQSKFRGIVDW